MTPSESITTTAIMPTLTTTNTTTATATRTTPVESARVLIIGAKPISPMLLVAVCSMIHLSFRNVFNYIDSPANISNYRDLQEHETYKLIHIQFCDDIKDLKSLTETYVGNQYTHLIEKLYDNVKNGSDSPECSLYPLFQHLRCPIHKLVSQLKYFKDNDDGIHNTHQQNQDKRCIVSLLNGILPTINSYSDGTHSWITALFSHDKASPESSPEYSSPIDNINELIESFQMSQLLASLYKEAVQRSDADTMHNLLLTGQCDLNPLKKLLNNTMQAPLSIFACKGVLGGLKYLLGKGNVDANQKDSDQKTPLHWAVSNGHIAIARQLLLVEHVRVTEKDKDGNTALQLAAGASNECPEMVQLIVNDPIGQFSVNISNDKKTTPLIDAIAENNTESAKILLSSMATDVSCLNYLNSTALHFAADRNNWQCVELILQRKKGREIINQLNMIEESPLLIAVKKNAKETLSVLLSTPGIDVNQHCQHEVTALHIALDKKHEECARMLLKVRGLDCNAVDSIGATPLHVAAIRNSHDMVSLLLSNKAINVRLINICNETALQIATRLGNVRTAEVLQEYENEHPISDSDDD